MCLPPRPGHRIGFLLIVLSLLPWRALAGPEVTGVRIGDYTSKTRFVLDLSDSLPYRTFTLADPYRVVIDLPEVTWKLKPAAAAGVISEFRYGQFEAGKSRIVLDVKVPVRITKSFILKPAGAFGHRLVIDLKRIERRVFLRGLKNRVRRTVSRTRAPPARAKPRRRPGEKRVIAIDPGHGGIDPGTTGVSGSREKRVVLAHARELRRKLLATGRYRVVMTRNRDVYVALRKRIDIARRAGADLFLSLHADSLRDPRVRGGSIYTLSEQASDVEAEALAAKENKADVIAGVDLNSQSDEVANILIDLAQRNSMNESADFARLLTKALGKSVRMLRNTHRFAGFAVLKAPDVPSVLVELGYLSNRSDERLLKRKSHRQMVSTAIVRAVNDYFTRQQVFKEP